MNTQSSEIQEDTQLLSKAVDMAVQEGAKAEGNNTEQAVDWIVAGCNLPPPVALAILKRVQQQFPGTDPLEAAKHVVNGYLEAERKAAMQRRVSKEAKIRQTQGLRHVPRQRNRGRPRRR